MAEEYKIMWSADYGQRTNIIAQLAVGAAILISNGIDKTKAYHTVLQCYADFDEMAETDLVNEKEEFHRLLHPTAEDIDVDVYSPELSNE